MVILEAVVCGAAEKNVQDISINKKILNVPSNNDYKVESKPLRTKTRRKTMYKTTLVLT